MRAEQEQDAEDRRRGGVNLFACHEFRLREEESLEVVVTCGEALFEAFLRLDLFGQDLNLLFLEELRRLGEVFFAVVDDVHLHVAHVREQRFTALDEFLVVDEVVQGQFETAALVADGRLDQRFVDFDVFQNLEDKAARVQQPEDVVQEHVAAAVDKRLVLADEPLEADVVEYVFQNLRRGEHVACNDGGVAFRGIAEQKFVSVNLTFPVKDRLSCEISERMHCLDER